MMAEIIPLQPWGATAEDWLHFDVLLGLTEDLLPVVSNPKAVVAENSSLKALGKVPSVYAHNRKAVGLAQWTQRRTTPQDISQWSKERDYGISVQCRRIRAVDIDVEDRDAAARVRAACERALGASAPCRYRANTGKLLLAFELPGDFTKRKFRTAHGIVEFLATGQQFVALGTHPSGARYEWEGGLPDAFPTLTAEQFEGLWSALVAEFAIEDATTQAPSSKATKLADVMAHDPVAQFLLNTNRVKRAERDGRLHIVCPWEHDHTTETGDSATTYWPAHTGGYAQGHFACLHAHCEARTDAEFLEAIEYADQPMLAEFEAIADGESSGERAEKSPAGEGGANHLSEEATEENAPTVKPARFAVQPAHAFSRGRPTTWLIKNVLPKAELGVLYGESGAGKSFAVLDLCADVAMGTPWRQLVTRRARVVYVVAEGAGGFRLRLRALAQQRGLDLATLPLGVISDAPNMLEKQDALDLAKSIVAAGGADLIVVDTLAQSMPGGNENSGEDVGRVLAHCKGLHRATGAMVLLIHHSGKDAARGARGWSGIKGAVDVELEVVRAEQARSLTVTKMKDGSGEGVEYAFRLESVVLGLDDDGEEITSCVVEHGEGRVRSVKRGPKGTVERLVVQALRDLAGLGDGMVELLDLKAAVAAQMPFDPAEGKRDRRGEVTTRAIESLRDAGRLAVQGTKLRLVEGAA